MRFTAFYIFCTAIGLAIAVCPYWEDSAQGTNACPYSQASYSQFERKRRSFPAGPYPRASADKKGVFLMNRIGPSTSTLYIANIDGTNERQFLKTNNTFDYHASFSPDGKWITFTSERNGDGNSDLYRVRTDASGLQKMKATPSFEDAMVLSPNGSDAAYVTTANGYVANICVLDLSSGVETNLTNTNEVTGASWSPNSYFQPAWSPDGQWILFSSDRNTGWLGHGNGTGWEHTQELSVYVIRSDGTGFRQLATKPGYALGSPKWSPDGKRVVFYGVHIDPKASRLPIPRLSLSISLLDSIELLKRLVPA
jgi:Tol biopolymer transport system component